MAVDPNLQMTLGRLQLRAGRTADALPILERVAAQAPWAAEPLVLLYEAYATSGKIDEAEKALIGAAQINPRYWAQLGQFYERRQQVGRRGRRLRRGAEGHAPAQSRRADSPGRRRC